MGYFPAAVFNPAVYAGGKLKSKAGLSGLEEAEVERPIKTCICPCRILLDGIY